MSPAGIVTIINEDQVDPRVFGCPTRDIKGQNIFNIFKNLIQDVGGVKPKKQTGKLDGVILSEECSFPKLATTEDQTIYKTLKIKNIGER